MDQTRVPFLLTQPQWTASKYGCMIAVSTKFPRTQIRCVHHWMPGWKTGLWLKCGVGTNAGDVYLVSAYAPVHDERTQTSTCEALRNEFWRKFRWSHSSSPEQVPGDSVHGGQWRSGHNTSLDWKCRQPNS